jgi:signal transduction histidine kinase
MIKKLQRKFIVITMGSLLLVMVLLIGSINAINLYRMDQRIDGALRILSENDGKFPKFDKNDSQKDNQRFDFHMNEETAFQTRYFVVEVSSDGSMVDFDGSHIAAISAEDAKVYVDSVLESGDEKGYEGYYKYSIIEQDTSSMIIFIDCRTQIDTAIEFLFTTLAVAAITLVLMFILISILSKRAINPIIESMEKQKQFITDAGHEIKTPLAIISANTDVLELTGGDNEWVTSIRHQTSRLAKLVNNLLMLSKMDESKIELVFSDFNLSETVSETADSFESIAEMKNKVFQKEIQENIRYHGDEGGIHQLVSILVDNAMKYSKENGTIRVSLSTTKKGIKLEVYNTTDDLDETTKENLDRLFDRFYRADSSRSRETGGYGIGLSIAKSIVEAHHGKIAAKSEDGKSISFIAVL